MSNLTIDAKINKARVNSLKSTFSKVRQRWDESSSEALLNAKKYKVENLDEMFLDLRKNV